MVKTYASDLITSKMDATLSCMHAPSANYREVILFYSNDRSPAVRGGAARAALTAPVSAAVGPRSGVGHRVHLPPCAASALHGDIGGIAELRAMRLGYV